MRRDRFVGWLLEACGCGYPANLQASQPANYLIGEPSSLVQSVTVITHVKHGNDVIAEVRLWTRAARQTRKPGLRSRGAAPASTSVSVRLSRATRRRSHPRNFGCSPRPIPGVSYHHLRRLVVNDGWNLACCRSRGTLVSFRRRSVASRVPLGTCISPLALLIAG